MAVYWGRLTKYVEMLIFGRDWRPGLGQRAMETNTEPAIAGVPGSDTFPFDYENRARKGICVI